MNTLSSKIVVELEDGSKRECEVGTPVSTFLPARVSEEGLPYIAALVNYDLCSLSYPLTVNSKIKFLTMSDPHGWRVYRRSLAFLLAKATRDVFPSSLLRIEHSFGLGLYCSFYNVPGQKEGITRSQIAKIEERMRKLVELDLPIERRKIAYNDAVKLFEETNQPDKLSLLKYRNPPRVVVYICDGFCDLAHGPLVPSTGVLTRFELIQYKPGFVLHLPDRIDPFEIPPFQDQPHLFQIFHEHKKWGRILGVDTVGRLNDIIYNGQIEEFIRIAESLHEKKISWIADRITERKGMVKLILIAGPSSAGKTTFAKRLETHLRVNGLQTITLAMDDYFVGTERTPLDETGNPDFEHIEAIDLDLFNSHLLALIKGEEIEVPHFNFETRQREYRGRKLKLEPEQIIIVEGIHGLNPRLTEAIPAEHKFKIYVSALTQLNLDNTNRISTTDNRLMRRMVRDYRYRGYSALDTLRRWPSVRRGEKRWVFPYQRGADATFNSALDYELAVLKPYVEPLLMQIKPDVPEYTESRRLTEFLLNFLPVSSKAVPPTSILREYIGGSSYHY
jgi:uridine kinase